MTDYHQLLWACTIDWLPCPDKGKDCDICPRSLRKRLETDRMQKLERILSSGQAEIESSSFDSTSTNYKEETKKEE